MRNVVLTIAKLGLFGLFLAGLVWAFVDVTNWLVSKAKADAAPTDVQALCSLYGGVKDGTWKKEVKTYTRTTYTVSVDCKDGSWVMRSYEK